MTQEANTEVVEQPEVNQLNPGDEVDNQMDKVFDDWEKEHSEDSSSETNQTGGETTTEEAPSAEEDKTERVAEVEEDSSLSADEKIAKISEILGDDEQAIDAYIQKKGYHNDPAWMKQREIIKGLKEQLGKGTISDEDRKALEDAKKITSTAEGIRLLMRQEGYSEDKINETLREKGFEVPLKASSDLELIIDAHNELNPQDKIDISKMEEGTKRNLSDIAFVVDTLLKNRLNSILPKEIAPLKEHVDNVARETAGNKLVSSMKDVISKEGILNWEKDIEPELDKWLDANPKGTQPELFKHFESVNHRLSIARLKAAKGKEARDNKKDNLRTNQPGGTTVTMPKKTGNFNDDADAILDALGASN